MDVIELLSHDHRMVEQLLHQAKKVAPTRPHPHIPDQPLGEAVLGAVHDRLRDRMQGRPRT